MCAAKPRRNGRDSRFVRIGTDSRFFLRWKGRKRGTQKERGREKKSTNEKEKEQKTGIDAGNTRESRMQGDRCRSKCDRATMEG